ncbi:hypothetical protein BRC89_08140 [Halobacteriales archaeon QS_4_70_19]|nr:MAG: hypothetical protein BRC89_08140 [Halobacteriales archaeon QS_4_70_19]
MTSDSTESGGIGGKKLAIVGVLVVGVVLLVRAIRGGGSDAEDAGGAGVDTSGGVSTADTAEQSSVTDDPGSDDSSGDLAESASDSLPVDTDVKGRFDEIDIVDAVYILVAGLKAAREEYHKRMDDSA